MRKRRLSTWRKIKLLSMQDGARKLAAGAEQQTPVGTHYMHQQAASWGHDLWEPRRDNSVRNTRYANPSRELINTPSRRRPVAASGSFGAAPPILRYLTAFLLMFSFGLAAGLLIMLSGSFGQ